MRTNPTKTMVCLLAVLALFAPAAAVAQGMDDSPEIPDLAKGTWTVDGFVGLYDPEPQLDEDLSVGVRLGRFLTDHLHLEGTLSSVELKDNYDTSEVTGDLEVEYLMIDVTLAGLFRNDKRFRPEIWGGIGWAFNSTDGQPIDKAFGEPINVEDLKDDSFTIVAGVGAHIQLKGRVSFRSRLGLRKFEDRTDDDIDREWTFGVSVRF